MDCENVQEWPRKILHRVLALTEEVVSWRPHDTRSVLLCAGVVRIHIGHPHHNGMGDDSASRLIPGPLFHHHSAVAHIELRTMVGNAQAQCEAEGITKPCHSIAHVRVCEFWNHCATRNGAVG